MQDLTHPDTFVPIKRSFVMTPSILIRTLDNTPSILQELEDLRSHVRFLENELMLLSSNKKFKSIAVSEGNVRYFIALENIIMSEAESNYSIIHTLDGKKILTSKTLKHWITKIDDEHQFIRIHRSFLVNKTHVLGYEAKTSKLLLSNDKYAYCSRSFKSRASHINPNSINNIANI